MSGWLMLACAKPDKNKKGNALGGAQPISSSAYSPVVRWLTHLVSEFYIRQKTRRNCSAIYGAAVKPRPNRLNFNNDNEAHAPENAKTMQRLLARWKIAERVRSTRRKEPGLHAAAAFRSRAVRN